MRLFTCVVLALGAIACSSRRPPESRPAAPPAVEEQLAAAELKRQADPAVNDLLRSRDARVQARAALAAGRIRMAAAATDLVPLLDGGGAGDVAAWALGRIAGGEEPLVRCVRSRCPSAAAAARALGGPGRGEEAIAALAASLDGPAPLAAEAGTALAIIARLGGKGADASVRDAAGRALLRAMARPELPVRVGAAQALGRIAKVDDQPRLPPALAAALADPDPELRSLAARAAGRQGAFAGSLQPLLLDPDWRVRVEAARALPAVPAGPEALVVSLSEAVKDASSPANAHALATMLESMGKAGGATAAAIPEPSSLQASTQSATLSVRCAAAQARDRAFNKLDRTPGCGAGLEPDWRGRARTAVVAAELGSRPEVSAAFADADARVRSAVANAAGPAFADALIAALADADAFVVAGAAGSLAKDPKLAAQAAPAAAAALARFANAKDKGAGDPSADALASLVQLIGAQPRPPAGEVPGLLALQQLGPVASPALFRSLEEALPALGAAKPSAAPAPALPPEVRSGIQRLRLKTTAGELVIRLRGDAGEAPITSAAVAALASRKFYDGLNWHRVVPDFVIQGGDPRGDGEGGPGWAIPDEHTPLRFRRGTLGIATSGPETGGSQIFLCHSPQPHLDGRYTIAGELESGEKAMDAIHVGDRIVEATVEPAR